MLRKIRESKGQSTLEYAILIVIVIAALLSLQVYVKRGVQGRLRSATDDIGDQFAVGNGSNFSKTVRSYSNTTDILRNGVSSSDGHEKWTNTTEQVNLNRPFDDQFGQ